MPASARRVDDRRELVVQPRGIEPALGRALLALFRHDAGGVRLVAQRDGEHLLGRRHFEVERQVGRLLDALQVVVADMAPVLAQMRGDAVAADARDDLRRAHRIGMVAAARIADRRDVIDVDAEPAAGRRCEVMVHSCAAARLGHRDRRQFSRHFVLGIGREVDRDQREERHAEIDRAAGAVDQRRVGDDFAALARDRGDRLAAGQAGGDHILDHQHLVRPVESRSRGAVRRCRSGRSRKIASLPSARPISWPMMMPPIAGRDHHVDLRARISRGIFCASATRQPPARSGFISTRAHCR